MPLVMHVRCNDPLRWQTPTPVFSSPPTGHMSRYRTLIISSDRRTTNQPTSLRINHQPRCSVRKETLRESFRSPEVSFAYAILAKLPGIGVNALCGSRPDGGAMSLGGFNGSR